MSLLALVHFALLRADARLVPLHHVVSLFTEILDVSPLLSLPQAAANGSPRLVDRVFQRLQADATLHPALLDFWLARSLQAALEQDDVIMIQHFHALRPAPLHVHGKSIGSEERPDTLGLALRHGTLETVQWVMENRSDRACCSPGISNYCRGCVLQSLKFIGERDAFRKVMWLFDSGLLNTKDAKRLQTQLRIPRQKSLTLVRWLVERELVDQGTVLAHFEDAMELLDLLAVPIALRRAQLFLLRASFHMFVVAPAAPGSKNIVQWKPAFIREKLSTYDPQPGELCCSAACACANVVALQWLYNEHKIPPNGWLLVKRARDEHALLETYKWMKSVGLSMAVSAMNDAAAKGFLGVVQWLQEHSSIGCTTAAMDTAVYGGYAEVVKWLLANRSEGCSGDAMINAAIHGDLGVVEWLHYHSPEFDKREAMCRTARCGHLDVLIWLARTYPHDKCTQCLWTAIFDGPWIGSTECKSLGVLHWIDSIPSSVCETCQAERAPRSYLVYQAAEVGDLELCEYLFELHRCTRKIRASLLKHRQGTAI